MPVDIVRKSAAQGYVIRLRDDEPQMNITLLEMLKQEFGIVINGLDPLPMDDHGIDIRKTLFNALASRGWAIIGIEALGINLEDIFIAVVDSPETDKKQKKSKKNKLTVGKGKKIEINLSSENSDNK